MRKIFLFLFAAVLSIGTAMAQTTHDFYAEGVTVSEGGWSINLSGSWNEQSFTVMLWQDNTQGFGTYAADASTGYSAQLGTKELTPTTEGHYTDMMDGTFTFQGTMTDGNGDIYEVLLKGAIGASSTPETGEMEAKNAVDFTCSKDGEWTIEAMADDDTWMMTLALTQDPETMEWMAAGEYTYFTDIENYETATEEVSGTGLLYFDDFSGCQVFRGTLTTESGEVYPTLYASSLTLMTNVLQTGASWYGEIAGVDYYEVLMMAADGSWELDLHARNCTGANGTSYTIDVVDEAEYAYSTFMGSTIVTGELDIDGGMYDAYVYTKDAEGNDAMYINATGLKLATTATVININDATVIEDLSQYGSSYSMKGEVELEGTTYPVTVDIAEEVDLTVPSAEVYLSVTVEDFGFVDGYATLTINGNTMAVAGELENEYAGVKFVFNISGTLPTCANIRLQAGNNAGILAAADGKQVNVTVARNFTANDGFYTLCVPFDMPASVIGKAFQIDEITESGAGGVNVEFKEVTDIVAGQPYLIEPATNLEGFTVNNVTIDNSTPAAVTVSGAGVSITMQGKYSRDAKTNGLYWIGEDGYLYNDDVWPTALCAYFNITTPSGIAPRMRVVTKEDAETGLDNITTGTKAVKAIVNGQLVIIRGGEMFNVQGQLVK